MSAVSRLALLLACSLWTAAALGAEVLVLRRCANEPRWMPTDHGAAYVCIVRQLAGREPGMRMLRWPSFCCCFCRDWTPTSCSNGGCKSYP